MKRLLIILALCSAAHAATVTVTSVEPTSHQIIVRYNQTNGTAACTFTPVTPSVVKDIDNTQFTGSNSDARTEIDGVQSAGDNSTGPDRVFVIGSPFWALNNSGNMVSRALRTNFEYTFTITCGAASVNFTKKTTSVPFANVLMPPPSGLLPTLDYNPANREGASNNYIDPNTGTLFKLLTYPGDVTAAPFSTYTARVATSIGLGTNWSNGGITGSAGTGTITSVGTAVTGSGTLFRTELNVGDTITCTAAPCTGQTAVVASISSTVDTSLTLVAGFTNAATGGQTFTRTWAAGAPIIQDDSISTTYTAGLGDKLFVGVKQSITSYAVDAIRLTLKGHGNGTDVLHTCWTEDKATCFEGNQTDWTPPAGGDVTVCFPTCGAIQPIDYTWGNPQPIASELNTANVGWLLWTTGTTISLQRLTTDYLADARYQFGNEGSQVLVSYQKVNDPGGNPGVYALVQNNGNPSSLYWINTDTGISRFVAYVTIDSGHMVDRNGSAVNSTCSAGGCFVGQVGGTWAHGKLAFYELMTDTANGNKQVLVEGDPPAVGPAASAATNTKSTVANGWTWRNLTPGSQDFISQATAFDAAFNPVIFPSVKEVWLTTSDDYVAFDLPNGGSGQDTLSWLGAIDPATGNIVGLTASEWNGVACSYCGEHSMIPQDTSYIADEMHSQTSHQFTSTLASPGCVAGTTDCPSGSLTAGSIGDVVQLIVTRDPTSTGAITVVGAAAIGDEFQMGSEWDCVSALGSDNLHYSVIRGCQGTSANASTVTSHANGSTMTFSCNAGQAYGQSNGAFFWNPKTDPHGILIGTQSFMDHGLAPLDPGAPDPTVGSGMVGGHEDIHQCKPGVVCRINTSYNTYVGTDYIHSPNATQSLSGQETIGPGWHSFCTGNGCQSHPSIAHNFLSSLGRRLFALDAHVFNGIADNYGVSTAAGIVNVSGDLWKGPRNAFTVGGTLTSISIAASGLATATVTGSTNVGACDLVYISGAVTNTALNGWFPCASPGATSTTTFLTTLGAGGPYNVASGDTGMTLALLRVEHDYFSSLEIMGTSYLRDVSGPGSNLLGDGTDDGRFCYVRNAGECHAGSQPGEWYATGPALDAASICSNTGTLAADDLCIKNWNPSAAAIVQIRMDRNEQIGQANMRYVLQAPVTPHGWSQGAAAFTLLDEARDGSGCQWGIAAFDRYGRNADVFVFCIPPETADVNLPKDYVFITDSPDSSGAVDHVIEKFGYTRSFHATQRNEVSVATQHLYDDTKLPFGYLGDAKNSVAMPGAVTIPVGRDRVVYRQTFFYDSGNNLLRISGGPGCGATPCVTIERTQ